MTTSESHEEEEEEPQANGLHDYYDDEDEKFDEQIENYMEVCANLQVPKYLPIDSRISKDVERLTVPTDSKMLAIFKKDLVQSTDEYLLYSLNAQVDEEKYDKIMANSLQFLRKLGGVTQEAQILGKVLQNIKEYARQRRSIEQEISLNTVSLYMDAPNPQGDLSTSFENTLAEVKASGQFDNTDNIILELQQHAFVVRNPQQPLPSELTGANDEDDVEIAGGTVELVCPITQQEFENPVITQCGHTFSKRALVQLLNSSRECPIPGCGNHLDMKSCQRDTLMELRVKSFAAIREKKEKESRQNLEIIA